MSVLIKGIEMPIVCDDCWALDDCGDYPMCRITQEQRGYNFNTREKRMDKCPLIEIPTPHGRLIDERKILLTNFEIFMCEGDYKEALKLICEKLDNAPTILEAEE